MGTSFGTKRVERQGWPPLSKRPKLPSMKTFRLVDCAQCGEEFNFNVTKTCPECKTIFTGKVEANTEDTDKKWWRSAILKPTPATKEISIEQRLEQIYILLYSIQKNVAFFAWVLLVSIVFGFILFLNNS